MTAGIRFTFELLDSSRHQRSNDLCSIYQMSIPARKRKAPAQIAGVSQT